MGKFGTAYDNLIECRVEDSRAGCPFENAGECRRNEKNSPSGEATGRADSFCCDYCERLRGCKGSKNVKKRNG